jgi:queuosine precursor transporter
LLSWILNREAGIIAIASTGAFLAAAIVDSIVYQLLEDRPRSVRVNGSNVAAAIVDSVLFVGIAFGSFLSPIVLAQVLAKITGGALWGLVLPQPAPVPLEAGT